MLLTNCFLDVRVLLVRLPNLLELDGFDRNGNLISDVSDYEEDEIVEEEQPYGDDDGDNKERQVEVNHFMSS